MRLDLSALFNSSIGLKTLMAVSGLLLLGFVVMHLLGNLQIFAGPDSFNHYAELIKGMPLLLWGARIGLIIVFITHISAALKLKHLNSQARPVPYSYKNTVQASTASLYMLETGIVVLLFVVIHLLHYTMGILQPEYFNLSDAKERHDVYSMVIHGFQNNLYASVYTVCMVLLGVHLSHGISSFFQTLGFNHPRYSPLLKRGGQLIATVISLGYISIVLSVYFGFIGA